MYEHESKTMKCFVSDHLHHLDVIYYDIQTCLGWMFDMDGGSFAFDNGNFFNEVWQDGTNVHEVPCKSLVVYLVKSLASSLILQRARQ